MRQAAGTVSSFKNGFLGTALFNARQHFSGLFKRPRLTLFRKFTHLHAPSRYDFFATYQAMGLSQFTMAEKANGGFSCAKRALCS